MISRFAKHTARQGLPPTGIPLNFDKCRIERRFLFNSGAVCIGKPYYSGVGRRDWLFKIQVEFRATWPWSENLCIVAPTVVTSRKGVSVVCRGRTARYR